MVQTDAVSVKRALTWQGGTHKITEAVAQIHRATAGRIRTMWQREGVQDRLQWNWRNGSEGRCRNLVNCRLARLSQPKSLVGEEEKRSVFPVVDTGNPNWATQGSTEIILPKWTLRNSEIVIKPIVRIEVVVS